MKFFSLILMLTAATPAFAQTCYRGQEPDDSRMNVVIGQSRDQALQFNFHESSFSVPASQVVKNGNTIAVLDRAVKLSAEGDESVVKVSAMLVLDAQKRTLKLALVMDGVNLTTTEELSCR